MSSEHSIPRRPAADPGPFESLRSEGVRQIQELSGELWTDFNLHDPGITILEQLCYGLTDLDYRARFPVEDHLASPDGTIDWEAQALHRPESVFPSRPTTLDDLRGLILDRVPEVEHVWIHRIAPPAEEEGTGRRGRWTGVYAVRVHLDGNPRDSDGVLRRVLDVVRSHRNLGEDVSPRVRVAGEVRCELVAQVEVGGGRTPEEVLAEIYARAHAFVAGRLEAPTGARGLEETFRGPLLFRGAHRGTLLTEGRRLHLADLVSLVRGIEGVQGVGELSLVVDDAVQTESVSRDLEEGVLCLSVPSDGADLGRVRLTRAGRPVAVSRPALLQKYRELRDRARLGAGQRPDPATLYLEPTGTNRDDHRYRSIQAHFPSIYGIGEEGVPDSASPETRAKAAQLKGYLLPMEQLLADQMTSIRHLRDLFSTADAGTPTYRHQVLGDPEVPGISRLYLDRPDTVLDRLYEELEGGPERRGRAVDHMLALYGEGFENRALRSFDVYGSWRTEAMLLRSKLDFLRAVILLGRDRGGSYDPTRPFWQGGEPAEVEPGSARHPDNVSGFQLRVGYLLGFRRPWGRSLVAPLTGEGLSLGSPEDAQPELHLECEGFHVLEHVLLRPAGDEGADVPAHGVDLSHRVSLFFSGWTPRCRDPRFRLLAEDTVRRTAPAHLHLTCHWLDAPEMARLEDLYRGWLEITADPEASPEARDRAAAPLLRFLRSREPGAGAASESR